MKPKKSELVELMTAAIAKEQSYLDMVKDWSQRNNPQVVEMCNIARGKILAYQAVLGAMKGETFNLKLDAGKM